MNRSRRSRIEKIRTTIENLSNEIEELQAEEQEAFDAMPESLQQGDRGQASEAAAEALQSAYDSSSEVLAYLDEASEP